MLDTIENVESLAEFKKILENNPGMVIVKFGAEWCKPCKTVEPSVKKWFSSMPNTVQTVLIDVDESFELYAYMKTKRMIRGIPAILMYMKGNTDYTYDDSVSSSNLTEVDAFFQRCLSKCKVPVKMPFSVPTPPTQSKPPAEDTSNNVISSSADITLEI